jgi:hypothetical protein
MMKYSTTGGSDARGLASGQQARATRSVKVYSGAGALRADITILWDMEDASIYERAVVDPVLRKLLGRFYGAIDLKTAGQSFRREVSAELIRGAQ